MSQFETVIGLEVHAQLATDSKLFCSCARVPGDEPNTNVCTVCGGMPGALPVPNKKAVEYAARMALAVDCTINKTNVFARKNYFYPDLPPGYQISQFELPIAEHGTIDIQVGGETKTIGITRIHMESDAGKSIHSAVDNKSYVDLNRAGTPLIEIVSEPDMRSAEEAVAYLKQLHAILLYLGICDGNMEKGNFRCDANVSIRPWGQEEFGTRAELKNMNSFRNVQRAIEYEVQRQEDVILDGGEIVQETRLFDADKGITASMRGKEEAHDYRYFPDPDLLPIVLDEAYLEQLKAEQPELPTARRGRFLKEYAMSDADADVLAGDRALADYFEETAEKCGDAKQASNWILSEVLRELNERGISPAEIPLDAAKLAALITLVKDDVISMKIGKNIFPEVFEGNLDPAEHVKAKGLEQVSDTGALETAVDDVLAENPDEVASFKGGKTKLMGFFVGQVMRKTKGQANPKMVNELLNKKLAS